MENLLLNWEFLKRCNYGVMADKQKQVMQGVFINDVKEGKNFYRYYIGCDGGLLLGYKQKRKEIEIKNLILNLNDFKPNKEQQKAIESNDNLILLEKSNYSFYDTISGRIYIIEGVYPNFYQLLSNNDYKLAEKTFVLSYEKHKILNQFWKTKDKFLSAEKLFYINKKVTDEKNAPHFNFRIENDTTLKFAIVMGVRIEESFNLEYLKDFDIRS